MLMREISNLMDGRIGKPAGSDLILFAYSFHKSLIFYLYDLVNSRIAPA